MSFNVVVGAVLTGLFAGNLFRPGSDVDLCRDWMTVCGAFVATNFVIDASVITTGNTKNPAVAVLPLFATLLGAQQLCPCMDTFFYHMCFIFAALSLIVGRAYLWEFLEVFFYVRLFFVFLRCC